MTSKNSFRCVYIDLALLVFWSFIVVVFNSYTVGDEHIVGSYAEIHMVFIYWFITVYFLNKLRNIKSK